MILTGGGLAKLSRAISSLADLNAPVEYESKRVSAKAMVTNFDCVGLVPRQDNCQSTVRVG
jgi:hypothetical protein